MPLPAFLATASNCHGSQLRIQDAEFEELLKYLLFEISFVEVQVFRCVLPALESIAVDDICQYYPSVLFVMERTRRIVVNAYVSNSRAKESPEPTAAWWDWQNDRWAVRTFGQNLLDACLPIRVANILS